MTFHAAQTVKWYMQIPQLIMHDRESLGLQILTNQQMSTIVLGSFHSKNIHLSRSNIGVEGRLSLPGSFHSSMIPTNDCLTKSTASIFQHIRILVFSLTDRFIPGNVIQAG